MDEETLSETETTVTTIAVVEALPIIQEVFLKETLQT
jgi:hypothetical protein